MRLRTTGSFWDRVLADVRQIQEYQSLRKCRPHRGGDICTTRKHNLQPIFPRLSQCQKHFFLLLHFVHAALAQGAPAMVTISPYCFQGIL